MLTTITNEDVINASYKKNKEGQYKLLGGHKQQVEDYNFEGYGFWVLDKSKAKEYITAFNLIIISNEDVKKNRFNNAQF